MGKRDLKELDKKRLELVEILEDLLALRDEVEDAERRLADWQSSQQSPRSAALDA
jgi:hypothetical protein